MKKIVDGNKACAASAYLFSEIAAIYPITPSSPMAQSADELASADKKNLFNENVKVVEMQSEAGAAGALHGALMTGSLGTTFTSSQGLLLMIPNMYKMAGECLPAVIHVAARTVATHALSIFGDHSDVYATRATGFCMLASTNVEQANHLAAVAHLSAIKGSLPFLHFFDGFRTSHENNKVNLANDVDLLPLIDYDKVYEFKNRMLNVGHKIQKGMAENEDIYFQSVEARNKLYQEIPDIVNDYMHEINNLYGTKYKPFNYYGVEDAKNVIVAMGSICDTARLVVRDLNKKGEKVGLVEVHLYRPFSAKYLNRVLPNTVKRIAVLDRTKEQGSIGEPLYLDIVSALQDRNIKIVGGRYGLSSKNTAPNHIYSVYQTSDGDSKNNFTIGINDDLTHLSLPEYDYKIDLGVQEFKIYGFGSDGMVSASKDIMQIIGSDEDKYVQSYNEYDSKKSGGVTIAHIRIGNKKINAPYYVTNPELIVVTKEEYFHTLNMIEDIKEYGYLVINTSREDLDSYLPDKVKKTIIEKHLKLYTIDAEKIALDCNIKGKISKIMEIIILHLLGVNKAKELISSSIEKQFSTKGEEIINANKKAIENAIDNLKLYKNELTYKKEESNKKLSIFERIRRREGDKLTVSDLEEFKDGTFPGGLTKEEKRKVSKMVPKWNGENCLQCNQCAIVCPHAVIRPFAITDKNHGVPMMGKDEYNFEMVVSEADCTSCGLCIDTCLGKGGNKALEFGEYSEEKQKRADELFNNYENPKDLFPDATPKGLEFKKSCFEFSGACQGCGETPYIKLLTQLLGEKLVIANATGCSSIYGGSAPATPYSIPWANSLFEDNAEFGYGMLLSYNKNRDRIEHIIRESIDSVKDDEKELFNKWLENREDYTITTEVANKLKTMEIPKDLKKLIDYVPARSVWCIGGDGWAYDIGFGGIDHVLSSNKNIKILVLDTEVYSNTGGQASKSSRFGQVAQFADAGKETAKKDLFRIAMSYPNCYVANISLGANFIQAIKAFKEADEHDGPAIVIAYAPCIEQGIKGGMINASKEQKLVVESGYINLMRYIPEEDKVYMDSREPDFEKLEDLFLNEVRYNSLSKKNPARAKELLELNKEDAKKRYNYYKELSSKQQ